MFPRRIFSAVNQLFQWGFLLCLMSLGSAHAQNTCQGFQNPFNFNYMPGDVGTWSARVGDRISGGASTGNNLQSTCAYPQAPVIVGHSNITSSQYYSGYCSYTDNICNHTFFDAHDHRFSIYTSQANAGLDEFTVNGSNGLPRIPPGFTTSIRLGDMRSTGSCVQNNTLTGNGKGSEALFFTMKVRPTSSLLFINYAVVARRYDHTPQQAGEFLIRVVGKNGTTNQWNNFPLNDSLWYCVPAPAFSSTLPAPWVEGRPGPAASGTTCSYCYKPWAKVAIDLSNYIYDSVRVEMYTSDCIYNVDPIYAYIAGSCQAMSISQHGCVSGETDVVDTLHAPEGLLSYTWYVSTTGFNDGIVIPGVVNNLNYRQVSTTSTPIHAARLSDFRITEGLEAGDTCIEQLYKCVVTSALDPSKPFSTNIYATVRNVRPIVSYNVENHCDGTYDFHAVGRLLRRPTENIYIVDSLTRWLIHAGGPNTPVLDTLFGNDVSYTFTDEYNHSVSLSMYSSDSGCYTTKTFYVLPRRAPQAVLDIASRIVCEGDTAVLTDRTQGHFRRQWIFPDTVIEVQSSQLESTRTIRRIFSDAVNPVALVVFNDSDCSDTVFDTIYYFQPSGITYSPDTVVCSGQTSHVTVSTPVQGCTFSWYRHYNLAGEEPFQQGNILRVAPPAGKATYYVKITTPQGCVAWDSVTLHLVSTAVEVDPPHASFCPGDSVTLTASGALHYRWESSPHDPYLDSQATNATIRVAPEQLTDYTLIGYAADSCTTAPIVRRVWPVPLPVLDVAYTPNIISDEDPVVHLYDRSVGRAESRWTFSDSVTVYGEDVSHKFIDIQDSAVGVWLTSFNRLRCASDTSFVIPVKPFGLWIPNVFTPSRESNNRFSIVTTFVTDLFQIYIFNRMGQMVFQSDDSGFQWDGTHEGNPLPQGSYNYRLTYSAVGNEAVKVLYGTITILR